MKNPSRASNELLEENSALKQRIKELERAESKHSRLKEKLRRDEEILRLCIEHSPAAIAMLDHEMKYIVASRRYLIDYGLGEQSLVGRLHYDVFPELPDRWKEAHRRCLAGSIEKADEDSFLRADGRVDWVRWEIRPWNESGGGIGGIILFSEVITDRKQAEEATRQSEERYQGIFESIMDVFYRTDNEGLLLIVSPAIERLLGYIPEEVIGKKKLVESYINSEERDQFLSILREKGEVKGFEAPLRAKDGSVVWVSTNAQFYRDKQGEIIGVQGIARDITDRKRSQDALAKSEDKFRKAFYTSPDAVNINSLEDGIYISINPGFTRITGYTEADIIEKTSIEYDIWDNIDDRERLIAGLKMDGEVINLEAAFRMKSGEIRHGLISASVIDLNGVPHILSITRDITERKRSEHALKESFERLHKSLGATVQAIAVTVETRDPYTAGHQRRVADLARAIATEMNLPIDIIDGIRMAAAIHDLGKISVPAEILSKPTKLKKPEFDLIKDHSQSGYDILKDVDFPWPIARMVLEHHERMNGSGYPNGLTGDNILMESRIISVADVVESMGSHRPYRPSLGIEAALEEIEKNKGIFYDKNVAEACLRLFREKGFKLEGT